MLYANLPADLKDVLERLRADIEALDIESAVSAFREEARDEVHEELTRRIREVQEKDALWAVEFDEITVEGDCARARLVSTITMQEFTEPMELDIRLERRGGEWQLAR